MLAGVPSPRCPRGQASTEYVAILAVVGVVLASAAAITTGGLGDAVLAGLRRGLCALTGARCPPARAAARPDLPPCPVARDLRAEELGVAAGIAKVGLELGLRVERRSDGRVTITFADAAREGLTAGVGAHLEAGPVRVGASGSADAALTFAAGRAWELPDADAAARFLRRYGGSQELLGRVWQRVREICLLCGLLTDDPPAPPPPDVRFVSGGGAIGLHGRAGAGPLQATVDAALTGALGRRVARDGATTWYVQVDGSAAAHAGFGLSADGLAAAGAVLAYAADRRGRPVRLTLTLSGRWGAAHGARLPAGLPGALGRRVERGAAVESESALDLADPANAAAARAVLAALRPGRGDRLPAALRALAGRAHAAGTTTVRTWRAGGESAHAGTGVGVGARLDADWSRRHARQALTAVATRLPGLGFLPRADCLAV